MRPEALRALAGCSRILHAGDVGACEVLEALEAIAPVVAVRGNNDHGAWADALPETADVRIGGARIHLLHDASALAIDARAFDAVVAGHSHQPRVEERDGVLRLNPGSAGPRRFSLPVTVARLTIRGRALSAELIELPVATGSKPMRPSRTRAK